MNAPCRDFRVLLERRLAGRAAPERLAELAWHEHLYACAECRDLLDAEEALESLLASLPEPRLAPDVRERVLARLRSSRRAWNEGADDGGAEDDRLDRLLDVLATDAPPRDLARHVLDGIAARRDLDLDRLLDLDVVETPAGLAQRTLVALRLARRTTSRRTTILRVVAIGAAAAALAAVVWISRPRPGPERVEIVDDAPIAAPHDERRAPRVAPRPGDRVAVDAAHVTDDVLAALDVLENWDLLVSDDDEPALPTADEVLIAELEGEG